MTEWWTYRPSDFLMFSPRTYARLFELSNAEAWPLHLLTLALGVGIAATWWRPLRHAAALSLAVVGALWLGVAWAFLSRWLASVHWGAAWPTAAFVIEGVLLLVAAARLAVLRAAWPAPRAAAAAIALWIFALGVQPCLGGLAGRPWTQAQVFGIAPDPTVVATLALLAMFPATGDRWLRVLRAALWLVPLAWCAVGSTTLATMDDAQAFVMPVAAAVALGVAARRRRDQEPMRLQAASQRRGGGPS